MTLSAKAEGAQPVIAAPCGLEPSRFSLSPLAEGRGPVHTGPSFGTAAAILRDRD